MSAVPVGCASENETLMMSQPTISYNLWFPFLFTVLLCDIFNLISLKVPRRKIMHWHVVGKLSCKSAEKAPVCPRPCAGLLKRICGVSLSDVSCIWLVSMAAFHLSGCRSSLPTQWGDGTALQLLSVEQEHFLPNLSMKNKLKKQTYASPTGSH